MAKDVVIIEAVRTAMGRRNGMLSGTHPVTLGAKVLREVVDRVGLDPALQGGRIVSVHADGACGVPVAFIDFTDSSR